MFPQPMGTAQLVQMYAFVCNCGGSWSATPPSHGFLRWRWFAATSIDDSRMNVPVAAILVPVDGYTQFVSLTTVWHLFKHKQRPAALLRQKNIAFWTFMSTLLIGRLFQVTL